MTKKMILSFLTFILPVALMAEDAAAGKPNAFTQMAPLALVFVIFYFVLIRPQKKKLDEEKNLISALAKGDEIFTKSGVIGVITGITEKLITLEISEGVKIKILKSSIGGAAKTLFASDKKKPVANKKDTKK